MPRRRKPVRLPVLGGTWARHGPVGRQGNRRLGQAGFAAEGVPEGEWDGGEVAEGGGAGIRGPGTNALAASRAPPLPHPSGEARPSAERVVGGCTGGQRICTGDTGL